MKVKASTRTPENRDTQEVRNSKTGGRARNPKKSSKMNKTISDLTMTRMLLDTPNGSRAKRYAIRQSIAVDGLLTRTSFYPSMLNSKAQDKTSKATTDGGASTEKGTHEFPESNTSASAAGCLAPLTRSSTRRQSAKLEDVKIQTPPMAKEPEDTEKNHVTFSSKIPTLTPYRNMTGSAQARKSIFTPNTGSKIPRPKFLATPTLMASGQISLGTLPFNMDSPLPTPRALPNYMRPTLSSLNKSSPSKHIFLQSRKSEHLMPSATAKVMSTTQITPGVAMKRKSEYFSATPLGKYDADMKRRKMSFGPGRGPAAIAKNNEKKMELLKTANTSVKTKGKAKTAEDVKPKLDAKQVAVVAKKTPKGKGGMKIKSENKRSSGTRQSKKVKVELKANSTPVLVAVDKMERKSRPRNSDIQVKLNETFTME